jgi:hypothetical protein
MASGKPWSTTNLAQRFSVVLGQRIAAGDQGGSVEEQGGRITLESNRRERPPTQGRYGKRSRRPQTLGR